jgi:hypothetical protein
MMSCAYKALPRIIPNLLLSAKKATDTAIVSPWIQDVLLHTPILCGDYSVSNRRMYLSQFLSYLIEQRQLRIFLIVREHDKRAQHVTRVVRQKAQKGLYVHTVKFLHAKAVVTNSNVLLTSANLIPTSLYRNVESCVLLTNQHGNTFKYLEHEYGIKLPR